MTGPVGQLVLKPGQQQCARSRGDVSSRPSKNPCAWSNANESRSLAVVATPLTAACAGENPRSAQLSEDAVWPALRLWNCARVWYDSACGAGHPAKFLIRFR